MIQRKDIMDYYNEPLHDGSPGSKLFNYALQMESTGNIDEAIMSYTSSINQGCAESAINLGVLLMYRSRWESCQSAGLFLWAGSKGLSCGYRNLAQMYKKHILSGGNEMAAEFYLRAAEMGDAKAQCNYAIMCKMGSGVKKNITESIRWMQKSADNGYYRAQAIMGDAYRNGDGVYKDIDCAIEWYARAAENGSPVAAYNLAMMYLEGKEAEKNEKFGRMMLDRAVNLGYSKAAYEAGKIAEAENDYSKAVWLYTEGANKGEPGCIKKLYELGYYDRVSNINTVSLDNDYK